MNQYIFSGSLPEEASTYVVREADSELYEGLRAGKFCYVLNSRQSGKSSLRVRTMRRLRETGVECAAIDLSAGGIQNVPPEQWYADLIDTLIDSFGLDIDFGEWWTQNQLNSLVTRFRKFLEEVLLAEIKENIVIFIDEIDSVLSLNFPTDDFFAFIRACYNQRVDNPEYNRLTFCLLGVASPSNLIEDKNRTPFNIGKAISLKGFQLQEVEPLEKGLQGRYHDSLAVMKEILEWTGGQPFLTQKLCQFMVEESKKEHPRSVAQVVRSRIIENWESQDEPEHLRTIRNRILSNEQRAPYLLELYQQIRRLENQSEMTADDTLEQSELQISGLVVRQQNKLRVYNPIYQEIFDQNWIETLLSNLRPYSENFRFWVASGGIDESRLLRGRALQGALEWAKDKNLNYQDKQFLAASQAKEKEEEIAAKEKEAQLERERKDREAAEQRNQVLTKANKKAQRRISIGTAILIVTLLIAVISTLGAGKQVADALRKVDNAEDNVKEKQEKVTKAEGKIKQLSENEEDIKKKAKGLEKDNKKLEEELQSKQDKFTNLDNERANLEIKTKELQRNINKINQQLGDKDSKLDFLEKEKKLLDDELNKSKKQLQTEKNNLEKFKKQVADSSEYLTAARDLAQLAGQLEDEGSSFEAKELFSQAGQSVNIDDQSLKMNILHTGISYAHQKLKSKNLVEATKYLKKVKFNFQDNSLENSQILVLYQKTIGNLLKEEGNNNEAIASYKKAFDILDKQRISAFDNNIKIISKENVEAVHRELINLLTKTDKEVFKNLVTASLKKHYFDELGNYLNNQKWEEADRKTTAIMLFTTDKESQGYFDEESINKLSCSDIGKIDKLWREKSNQRFGFSVQKQIWLETGNGGIRSGSYTKEDEKAYLRFAARVGWYDEKERDFRSYNALIRMVSGEESNNTSISTTDAPMYRGTLPSLGEGDVGRRWEEGREEFKDILFFSRAFSSFLALRLVNCNI